MSFLELQNLSLRFGPRVALDGLSLTVEEGEFFTLLGPSGCGKTTTIRLIAGFLHADSGVVLLQGSNIGGIAPEKRNIGMVFQSYALFPHLNVFDNVAFGLRARRVPGAEIPGRVRRALELVNLSGTESRPVFELSGGEQQRIAIARAIVIEPRLLLLDEPLSNLDAALRESTRKQLRQLVKSLGITTVFVTHDQEEAFALSDRIALLWNGSCQQIGVPQELYHQPANEFTARFIGKSNILSLPCRGVEEGDVVLVLPSGGELTVPLGLKHPIQPGPTCKVMIRPEALQIGPADGLIRLGAGRVLDVQDTGNISEIVVESSGMQFIVAEPNQGLPRRHAVGEEVQLFYLPEAIHVLP